MMDMFRAYLADPDCKDAGNPFYPGLGYTCKVPFDKKTIINKGYYEWKAESTPNYGTGKENWAFIPADQVPKLKNNFFAVTDQAAVDASPAAGHVQFSNGSWHTILISAEGIGGDHLFALDITSTGNPHFLWEFGDPDLYRSYSSPAIATMAPIGSGDWAAFFVSGLNRDATAYPSVYAVDVETGDLLNGNQKILLDTDTAGEGGTASGQPAVVDSDGDGYSDVMYVGSDKGIVYKIDLPSFTVCTFADLGQPIQASPAVVVKNEDVKGTGWVGNVVLVGTGDSPYYEDSPANAQYSFFALNDKRTSGSTSGSTTGCSLGTPTLWEKTLPPGHRVFASAFATAGKVYFGTSTADTDDPCAPPSGGASGTGSLFSLDVITGLGTENNIGNITTTPIVDDQHVYTKLSGGDTNVTGGNDFQNPEGTAGSSKAGIQSWKEITQ